MRGGGTGVVRQDAQPAAQRETLHDVAPDTATVATPRHDAVLLVGVAHDEAVDRTTLRVAHRAVAVVHALALGATVAAHRHPAGVDDRPALVGLMADDGGEHRERELVEG